MRGLVEGEGAGFQVTQLASGAFFCSATTAVLSAARAVISPRLRSSTSSTEIRMAQSSSPV